nr:PREDICTED: protein xmas-2 [Bemisia tabaci]
MDPSRPKSRSRRRTITIVDLPEGFEDRKTIRQHFSQFGHVTRVTVSDDYSSANVYFKTEEDARNAVEKGEVWRDELLTIAEAHSLDPRMFSLEDGRSYEDLDLELLEDDDEKVFGDCAKNDVFAPPLHNYKADEKKSLKRIRSSRKLMMEHLGAPKIKRPSSSIVDLTNNKPVDHPDLSSGHRIQVSGETRMKITLPSAKLTKPKQAKVSKSESGTKKKESKMSPKDFKYLVAKSLKDKFTILNERDKWLKKLLAKSSTSKSTLKGTCPDMCPEKERIMRDYRTLFSIFEAEGKEMIHELAIKEYSRSSADQEEPLPHELRPAPVLTMTMSYLINYIIPEIDNSNLKESVSEWFDFCWDRLRGIRKDITQQQLCDISIVSIIEQCARFHIACYDRLYGLEMKIFDQKINRENIMNCLSSLNHLYDSLSSTGACTNEAEFKAYQVLLQLSSSDILWEFQNFPQHIQASEELKVAVKAYLLFSSRSYAQFFDLVEKTSYLNSCLLQTYFPIIRETALIIIIKAYSPPMKVFSLNADFVKQSLRLGNAELQQFCQNDGIGFNSESNEVIINRDEFFARDTLFNFDESSFIVLNKREALSYAVVKSRALPPYEKHKVHSSFDDEGKLNKLAYQAIDQEMKLKQDFDFSYRPLLEPSEMRYDSDSDVQIISDDEDPRKFSDDDSSYAKIDIDNESELNHPDAANQGSKYNVDAVIKEDSSLEALEEARRRLIRNLEKEKHLEDLIKKEKEWKMKEAEEQRKTRLRKLEAEKQREALKKEQEMEMKKELEVQKLKALMRDKQRMEEEARMTKLQRELDIKRMEEEVRRRMNEENLMKQRLLEEQRRQEEERRRQEEEKKKQEEERQRLERVAIEQERMRQQEIERQRRICEEEEKQRRLREEQRKIKEEQERLRRMKEEEKRKEEEARRRKLEEAERQRKLKEEIRRQHLLKEKDEELKILRNYLGMRLKALSVRHYAKTWKRKIDKIRQAKIDFPALVRMTADENLALWGTVGNRTSVPCIRTSERINRLKSTGKVICKLNQSKLDVPFVGDILAEKVVDENLKMNKSFQFLFCKLVFSLPPRDRFDENLGTFLKQSLSSALLPKGCNFSEGFSVITSHNIPVFMSINMMQGSNDSSSCHGMNGLVIFSQNESYDELKTRICKTLSSLKCSVPIPLIITTIDEVINSKELINFLDLLKKDRVLICWEFYNWTNWAGFCKNFLSSFSKFILSSGNFTVNSFCFLMKNLVDEFFSLYRKNGESSTPVAIIQMYNKFLAVISHYLVNFKYQDIPSEFEPLLVKSCCRVVCSEKPDLSNNVNKLEKLLDSLRLEDFKEEVPKNVRGLLDLLENHCHGKTPLFGQIVRLLELNNDDDKDFQTFLKRVSWISIIELLAQEKLEILKKTGNNDFVVFRMKDLLELTHKL